MRTKERYKLLESKEVYSVFLEIISTPGIQFQMLAKKMNKSEGSISQQIKPLIKEKIVFTEGSGKKNHPLILKVSRKGFFDFMLSKTPEFKEYIELFNRLDPTNKDPSVYEDIIMFLQQADNFEQLTKNLKTHYLTFNKIYLF